jgi:DNA gyrase/topoisomerase IV subunit A
MFKLHNSQENNSKSIDDLEKLINENSSEHELLLESFKRSMNSFATERSMDTCLESLNVSIQLASVRSTLMELYKTYCRILENEVVQLRKICQKDNPS